MTMQFDTLSYVKHLRQAGVEEKIAEAHAEAARDFFLGELVTKRDLHHALQAQTGKFNKALLTQAVGLTTIGIAIGGVVIAWLTLALGGS